MEKEDSERPVSPSPSSAKSRGTNYKRNTKEERAMYIDLRDARVPTCLYWDCDKVGDWIEDLGFPQYRECFTTNFINGRKLIIMDASHLPRIGIYDFKHIQFLTRNIRELLNIEDPDWDRRIYLPPRSELGMYLEAKSRTGVKSNQLTYEKFDEDFEEAKWQPPLSNMCQLLPR